MRKLSIIGIGAGHPDYITVQADQGAGNARRRVPDRQGRGEGRSRQAAPRALRPLASRSRFAPSRPRTRERDRRPASYETAVTTWHDKRAAIYEAMIRERARRRSARRVSGLGRSVLYDSTLRIVDQVAAMKTVAARSRLSSRASPRCRRLAAQHQIALNRIGGPVHITTGRQLAKGLPGDDTVGDARRRMHLQDREGEQHRHLLGRLSRHAR